MDGETGEESLRELEARYDRLPGTVEQLTGGGGRHLFFRYPQGEVIGNAVRFAPGLDVKAAGGYVVIAPSLHISGRQYIWEVSSRTGEVPIAEAPAWFLNMLRPAGGQGMSRTVDDWRRLVAEGVEEGVRNNTIAALAGHLLKRDIDPFMCLDLLLAWNRAKCCPPLPDEEVVATVNSIARLEARRRGVGSNGASA